MSIENSRPLQRPQTTPSQMAESAAVSLEVGTINSIKKNKEINIRSGDVTQIAKGLAEVAFSIGQTNDPQAFSADLAEDIM